MDQRLILSDILAVRLQISRPNVEPNMSRWQILALACSTLNSYLTHPIIRSYPTAIHLMAWIVLSWCAFDVHVTCRRVRLRGDA
jgi:hypothetical protein